VGEWGWGEMEHLKTAFWAAPKTVSAHILNTLCVNVTEWVPYYKISLNM